MRISDWSSDVCSSDLADSRTWLTEPGAAVSDSVHRVWIESAMISLGCSATACSRMRSTPVSASALTPSSGSPSRAARPATCASDSSPVTYSPGNVAARSEEHTSELQSLMRISYAVFCLKKKNNLYYIQSLKLII